MEEQQDMVSTVLLVTNAIFHNSSCCIFNKEIFTGKSLKLIRKKLTIISHFPQISKS